MTKMSELTHDDVKRINEEEYKRVEDATTLYDSLVSAVNGDDSELEKQMYTKYYLIRKSLNGNIRFIESRLNNLAIRMKDKYASSDSVSHESIKIGNNHYSATIDRKVFDEIEIDSMLVNFIADFNTGFISLDDSRYINVPSIYSFNKDDEAHSNNSLLSYICGNSKEIGMFEVCLLKNMEQKLGTVRHMVNGKETKVNLNDLDIVNFEDINTYENENGEHIAIDEIIGVNDSDFVDADVEEGYQPSAQMLFIKSKFKDILTNNQVEKLEQLVEAVEDEAFDVSSLFHKVTDELIISKLGEIWFPERDNSYRQPAVRQLLNSMRKRMSEAMEKSGIKLESGVRSTFREFEDQSEAENKKWIDYDIDRFIEKDVRVDKFHENIDIKFENNEQFIPYFEYEKLENNEQSVSDIIKKYTLTKKRAENPHGDISHYVLCEDGEPLFTDEEIKQREDAHCKQLMMWVREREIVFESDEENEGYLVANTHKLHDISVEDYSKMFTDIETVRKYMNREYFNTDNRYILADTYHVDVEGDKYQDKKNYEPEEKRKQSKKIDDIAV